MKKRKILIASCSLLVILTIVIGIVLWRKVVAKAEYVSDYAQTFGQFTASTSSVLLKNVEENSCYSPISLFGAMSLTTEITKADTQKELLKSLDVDSLPTLEKYYKQMLGDIVQETEDSKITLANSLWIEGNSLDESFETKINSLNEDFDCELFLNSNINADEVNNWVNTKTCGLIKDILDKGNQPGGMALVNTLYYKSKWFIDVKEKSSKQEFHLTNGDSVQVDFLSTGEQSLEYKSARNYTYVVLPMEVGELVLVLPKKGKEPSDIMKKKNINNILAELSTSKDDDKNGKEKVIVEFPKYDIEYEIDTDKMKKTLNDIGIHTLFSNPEWIDGINGSNVEVIQKTRFIVDEEGVEGAASTNVSVYIAYGANESEPLELVFDRPFMYILVKDDVPLFIGTVYNPVE